MPIGERVTPVDFCRQTKPSPNLLRDLSRPAIDARESVVAPVKHQPRAGLLVTDDLLSGTSAREIGVDERLDQLVSPLPKLNVRKDDEGRVVRVRTSLSIEHVACFKTLRAIRRWLRPNIHFQPDHSNPNVGLTARKRRGGERAA
jgi:hypothetical protein